MFWVDYIDQSGYSFVITYASGQESVIPWDFVKSIGDDEYQQDLADKSGIQGANIARIESGKHTPYLVTLERIAKAMDLPVICLIDKPGN